MDIYLKALEHDMKLLELCYLVHLCNLLEIEKSKNDVYSYIYRLN